MAAIDVVTILNAKLQSGVPLFDVDVMLVDTYGECGRCAEYYNFCGIDASLGHVGRRVVRLP